MSLFLAGIGSNSYSQANIVFKAEETMLSDSSQTIINEILSNYRVITFDFLKLNEYVKRSSNSIFTLLVESQQGLPILSLNLSVEENDLRAPNYKAELLDGNGVVLDKQNTFGPVITYKGIIEDQAENMVRMTLSEDFMHVMMRSGNSFTMIHPVSDFIPEAANNLFLIYTSDDIGDIIEDMYCGTDAPGGEFDPIGDLTGFQVTKCTAYTLEIATEADWEYVKAHKTDNISMAEAGTLANAHILEILNVVDGLYQTDVFRTRLSVTYQGVYAGENKDTDPYDDDEDIIPRTQKFGNNWNANPSRPHSDVAHLFSGIHLSGTGGVSLGIGTICRQNAYIGGRIPGNKTPYGEYQLTAHEIGHALNATHDPVDAPYCTDKAIPSPIMCPDGFGNALFFSVKSKNQILPYLNNYGSCLDPIEVPCDAKRSSNDDGSSSSLLENASSVSKNLFIINTVQNEISLHFAKAGNAPVHYTIYNLLGQPVVKGVFEKDNVRINLQDYAINTAVIIHIAFDDGSIQVKKLMIN